jgi:acetylglutamate kinase
VVLLVGGINPVEMPDGGGPQIEVALNWLSKSNNSSRVARHGRRNHGEALPAGALHIVGLINQAGGKAVSGRDGGLIRAQKLKMMDNNDPSRA